MSRKSLVVSCALLVALAPGQVQGQTLETETARLVRPSGLKVGFNFEMQRSSEGREIATPLIFEYGLDSHTELVVEPIFYTSIQPKFGRSATGAGDVEVTLVRRIVGGPTSAGALAIAGEVKVPTARNSLIGTGRTDFAGYLIGSRRFGPLDLHLNVGYTIVGRPKGVQLRNIFNASAGTMLYLTGKTRLFAEVLANTAAALDGAESSGAPEITGGEVVGTVGFGRIIGDRFFGTLGVSYDNNGAVLIRPGFMMTLH